MKIAVTAANGQLGSSVVDELKKQIGKKNVFGIVRSPEKASHLGIEVRKGDYNCPDDFNTALKGIDSVLLISGMDDPQKRKKLGEYGYQRIINELAWHHVAKNLILAYKSLFSS